MNLNKLKEEAQKEVNWASLHLLSGDVKAARLDLEIAMRKLNVIIETQSLD